MKGFVLRVLYSLTLVLYSLKVKWLRGLLADNDDDGLRWGAEPPLYLKIHLRLKKASDLLNFITFHFPSLVHMLLQHRLPVYKKSKSQVG